MGIHSVAYALFLKGPAVNILGLADLTISVTTTQHCCYSTKAIRENTGEDE